MDVFSTALWTSNEITWLDNNPLVAMFFAVNDLDLNEIDLSYLSSTAEYSEQYFDKENRENWYW